MTEPKPVIKTARELCVGDVLLYEYPTTTVRNIVLGWRKVDMQNIRVRVCVTEQHLSPDWTAISPSIRVRYYSPDQRMRVIPATDATRAEAEEVDGATDGYNPTTDFIPDYVAGERDD